MTDIAQGNLGTVGKYEIDLEGGFVVAKVGAGVAVGSAEMVVKISLIEILELAKKKIPGTIDDVVIDLIKAAMPK